ncbi:bile acid:sodium symporter [Acetobacter okinawensis]|uniref:bile acid:sodium symporter family protein n=1 Tax=Acetobacter okinawensis TaxID=1076594 RepID=UPI001BAB4434|nr:bile acid:sodium symporter family protein [Acetobacter okinawensis]MBS0966671.1 bile acid:sodium symporter [Acetobacter okinawensis]
MRKLDPFLTALIGAVVLATFLPCHGLATTVLEYVTDACIMVMFFMQGLKLERRAILDNMRNWQLQGLVLACTFALFPALGLGLHALAPGLMENNLWLGVLFLCCLPSTVQSSIALTSLANGNVAASICAATLSNIAGIFITPALVSLVLHTHGVWSAHAIIGITLQLLLPFVAGQLLQPFLYKWAHRNKKIISVTDRSSIILVVYTAFSHAVVEGIWLQLSARNIATLIAVDTGLLLAVLTLTLMTGKIFGFSSKDEVSLILCGSKKSLASGVPIANVLFPASTAGFVILPLILYHQIQLFLCTLIARHYHNKHLADV